MADTILKEEEIVSSKLRSLYEKYGYLPYKMSKFEEYDLYARNKEFLDGARIVTFNDTDGKLLALKPDITLSIVKNDQEGEAKRKVYYHETVYRAQKSDGFRELRQMGLECIGALDLYDEYETVFLAAASLDKISPNFVLDLSHRGILSAVIEETKEGKSFASEAMKLVAEKNVHGINALCEREGVNGEKLKALVQSYGAPGIALKKIEPLCESETLQRAFEELKRLCVLLEKTQFKDRIRLDFSVVGSGNYYDGVVFNGFVDGIGKAVLSGGRYDRLLIRMGKRSGAIGFAVYLDLLEGFDVKRKTEDVDVVVLYDDTVSMETLIRTVDSFVKDGFSVSAQRKQGNVRCKKVVDVTGGGTW